MASGPYETPTGGFEIRWREGTKNRSKTFKPASARKRDIEAARERAIDWRKEVDRRQETGAPVYTRRDIPTVDEMCEIHLAAKHGKISERTERGYAELIATHISPSIGHLSLIDCRPGRMEEWQAQRLKEGAGPAVLGKAQGFLSSVFQRAVRREYIEANPLLGMERPGYKKRPHRWLSARQVEQIRGYFLDKKDVGSATLVSVLGYVGIRPQDALALEVAHIGERLQVVQKVVDGEVVPGSKTGESYMRSVPIPEAVRADLGNWMSLARISEGLVFPRSDGKPWTRSDWDNWRQRQKFARLTDEEREAGKKRGVRVKCFRGAAEQIGLEGPVRPYDLRHTAATLMIAAGWTVAEVAYQLGHSISESMRTYQHLLDEAQGAERRDLDDLIAEARGLTVRPVFVENVVTA